MELRWLRGLITQTYWTPKIYVVVDSLLHFGQSVAGRQDFNAEEWRFGGDLTGRRRTKQHRDVRDTKTIGVDLDTLLRQCQDAKLLLSRPQIRGQGDLQAAVIILTHISLQQLPFKVIAVRPVAGVQVFIHRNSVRSRHCSFQFIAIMPGRFA